MSETLRRRVLEFLAEHHVMTLATQGPDGPWAAAVFYAHRDLELCFLSSPTSRHAANLGADPRVAVTIQRDYTDWPGIRGIQIAGRALPVAAEEEGAVRAVYGARFPVVGKAAQAPAAIVRALAKIRWYRVVPEDLYLIDNTLGFAHREHLDCR